MNKRSKDRHGRAYFERCSLLRLLSDERRCESWGVVGSVSLRMFVFSPLVMYFNSLYRNGEGHLRSHMEMTRKASTTVYSRYLHNKVSEFKCELIGNMCSLVRVDILLGNTKYRPVLLRGEWVVEIGEENNVCEAVFSHFARVRYFTHSKEIPTWARPALW